MIIWILDRSGQGIAGVQWDVSGYLLMEIGDHEDDRRAIRIVDKSSYYGFDIVQPVAMGRGTSGEALRVIAPVSKKRWAGTVILDKVPHGYVLGPSEDHYNIATDSEALKFLRHRELRVYCFGDTWWWNAAWDRQWLPNMAYDPLAIKRRLSLGLAER